MTSRGEDTEHKLLSSEYVRGYQAAMDYASDFARAAGDGTPFKSALDILATHLEEKAASAERAAEIEARLAALLASSAAAPLPTPVPPAGYSKLPAGVRCRCVRLWTDGSDYYCCKSLRTSLTGDTK